MMVSWLRTWAFPVVAIAALSACQSPGYQQGNAHQTFAAAPSLCDQVAAPRSYYQQPVRYAAPSACDDYVRPARTSYHYARASQPDAAYRPRSYRRTSERYVAPCGSAPRSSYQQPARYAAPSACDDYARPARTSYRYARASQPDAAYRPRGYRRTSERFEASCGPAPRRSYRSARPSYDVYRPTRYRTTRVRQEQRYARGTCCY